MIRIAFVIDTIEKPTAGTEQQLLLLLKHLDRTKFDPVLCVLRSSKWLKEDFSLCTLHVIGIHSFTNPFTIWYLWRFIRFLKDENITVIYSFFRDGTIVGVTAGKLARVRLNIIAKRNQGYSLTFKDRRIRLLNYWANLIIANSQDTKNWINQVEGQPFYKITVVHNGIDLKRFQNIPVDCYANKRAELGLPIDAFVVGIVANLRPVKAHDVFLKAAHLIAMAIPETHFVLVGDGDQHEPLDSLARELKIEDQVHFIGRRQDIPETLATFDIGVLSSHSESFPNTALEYLAMGLPIVCTDVGGIREIVEDGINGYIVQVGDYALMAKKIITILRSEKAMKIKKISKQKAEKLFGLEKMVENHEKIFMSSYDCF